MRRKVLFRQHQLEFDVGGRGAVDARGSISDLNAQRLQDCGTDLDGVPAARRIVESLCPTLAVNVLGVPSVAVPVGVIDGLPQAVQVMGPRFGEALCLDAAAAIERAAARMTPVTPAPQS